MERGSLRIFIDASVLFSASASPTGASREIIRYALRGEITPIISQFALAETERNLSVKRPEALALFAVLRDTVPFEIVEPTKRDVLRMQPYVAFKDAAIVAAARKAGVFCLVTLDRRHLIEGREEREQQTGVKILLPGELLEILRQRKVN